MTDADQERRAEESRREPDDKYHQHREAEEQERSEAADALQDDPQPRDDG